MNSRMKSQDLTFFEERDFLFQKLLDVLYIHW